MGKNKVNENLQMMKYIKKVFKKAGVKGFLDSSKNTLYTINEIDEENDFVVSDLFYFNYLNLNLRLNKGNLAVHANESFEWGLLRQAYMHYHIGNFLDSYKLLSDISYKTFQNRKFILFFISEFNRKNVGKMITSFRFKYEQDVINQISDDIDKINLEELYASLPFTERRTMGFIKSIINFNFVYQCKNQVNDLLKKVETEKETVFIGGIDLASVYHLKYVIEEFWRFINFNCFIIEHYVEVEALYKEYVEAILLNYSNVQNENNEEIGFLGIKGELVEIKELDKFTLYHMIKNIQLKHLERLFEKYSLDNIKVSGEDKEYLYSSYSNIMKSLLKLGNEQVFEKYISNFLLVFSRIELNNKQFNSIVEFIIKGMWHKQLDYEIYKKLKTFFVWQYRKNNIDIEIIDIFATELVKLVVLKKGTTWDYEAINSLEIVKIVGNILKNIDSSYELSEQSVFWFLSMQKHQDITNIKKILIPLFEQFEKPLQDSVVKLIKERLSTDFDYRLYYEAVIHKIINADENMEPSFINKIRELIYKGEREQQQGRFSMPDPIENSLMMLTDLVYHKKIISISLLEEFRGKNNLFDFIFDETNFDYDKFDINWLKHLPSEKINDIAKLNKAKIAIKKKLNENLLKEKLDYKLKKIYVDYFSY